jgi:glycine cleavage system H protein
MVPKDLKYTKTHEWARIEGGTVTVGITDFAVHELGDIVFLELACADRDVKQEGTFGVVESVKAAVDLCSPVSGHVVEVHADLANDFATLANDPFGNGWMIKVKPADLKELDSLMTAAEYEEYVKTQEH